MKLKFLLMLLAFGLVAGAAQANLLLNPSFEDGLFSGNNLTPDFWTNYYTSYTATHIWHDDADEAHRGDKYMQMKMWTDGYSAWLMQTVDVVADQEYAFSVWAKNPAETQQQEAWGYYEWTEPNATNESGYRVISEGYLEPREPSGDEWELVDFGSITAPSNAKQVIFSLVGVPENGWGGILYDDVAMYGPDLPTDGDPRNQEFMAPYGDGATGDEVVLSWTNIDPNTLGDDPNALGDDPNTSADPVYVYVWFGTDPNRPKQWEPYKIVAQGSDITSLTVNAPPPSTSGRITYYWQVDSCIDPDHINEPNTIEGPLWMFRSLSEVPASVTIGTPAMITWDDEPVDVNSTVTDDGASPMTLLWTAEPNNIITFEPNEFAANPRVRITKGLRAEAYIVNPSFEDGMTGWDGRGGTWTGGYAGVRYVMATDGIYCAYTWSDEDADAGMSQTLTETLAADTAYTLTVDVANDGYYEEDVEYKVQLLAGENVLAEDDDEHSLHKSSSGIWETSTVVYTLGGESDPNSANIGEPLEIRLIAKVGTGDNMSFDNVNLTADPGFRVQPGDTYTLTVRVEDAINVDTDTMTIDVYDDECQMARIGLSLAAENLSDADGDCDIDLKDLYEMFLTWLDESVLTEPLVKP